MSHTPSKLTLAGDRIRVSAVQATQVLNRILIRLGCAQDTAQCVSEHLVDTGLCGMESHGVMRILQYAEQFQTGYMSASARPAIITNEYGGCEVDGGGGIGIPTMALAYQAGVRQARESGVAALAVRHLGHTGRHGAFAESAANDGCLTLCMGGGNRQKWRQVAPHGGARGMLPTNPWCAGIPGGDRGPVIMDFATSKIAGGWIYAAESAGALLPENCVIDSKGNPTRDPQDYFDGGAILPAGEQKGYALALVAELIGEAMLGPSSTECNWLLICVDSTRFRNKSTMQTAAEQVLEELRQCPPAPGFEAVEIPGERERQCRDRASGWLAIPEQTWQQILMLQAGLITAEHASD